MPSAMPMIGVDSGAMIIAPITVAVESVSTPAEAITADRVSIVQNADRFEWVSPAVRSRSSVSSASERRCESGRTARINPMAMSMRADRDTFRSLSGGVSGGDLTNRVAASTAHGGVTAPTRCPAERAAGRVTRTG